MATNGYDLKQLHQALLSAFPSQSALARMVQFGLGENLAAIAGGGNLSDVVFALLNWAESREKLDELVEAARKENPGNPALAAVRSKSMGSATAKVAGRSAPAANDGRANDGGGSLFSYDVFLSHQNADKDRARRIAEQLRDRYHFRVWFDEWEIGIGTLMEHIARGIKESRVVLIACTREALQSRWVQVEHGMARGIDSQGSNLLPLKLEKIDLPPELAVLRWVDMTDPAKDDERIAEIARLVAAAARTTPAGPAASNNHGGGQAQSPSASQAPATASRSLSPGDLRTLRETLAKLYPHPSDAARLVDDAEMSRARIDLQGSPVTVWHHVLDEARKQDALEKLLAIAAAEYPHNQVLAAFTGGTGAISTSAAPPAVAAVGGSTETDLLDALCTLLPAQFDEVVFRLGIQPHALPSEMSPLGQRAQALVRRMQQQGPAGLRQLAQTIERVRR